MYKIILIPFEFHIESLCHAVVYEMNSLICPLNCEKYLYRFPLAVQRSEFVKNYVSPFGDWYTYLQYTHDWIANYRQYFSRHSKEICPFVCPAELNEIENGNDNLGLL